MQSSFPIPPIYARPPVFGPSRKVWPMFFGHCRKANLRQLPWFCRKNGAKSPSSNHRASRSNAGIPGLLGANSHENNLMHFFRRFSLQQRFMVAPLLGLVVCSLLTAAFIYESQRQNALLSRITERDLAGFNRYSEVFRNL